MNKILFEVETPLKIKVKTTEKYWRYIVEIKHPVMSGKEGFVVTCYPTDKIKEGEIIWKK